MVYMYHSFLIHSSADGHLGCFHVLASKRDSCHDLFKAPGLQRSQTHEKNQCAKELKGTFVIWQPALNTGTAGPHIRNIHSCDQHNSVLREMFLHIICLISLKPEAACLLWVCPFDGRDWCCLECRAGLGKWSPWVSEKTNLLVKCFSQPHEYNWFLPDKMCFRLVQDVYWVFFFFKFSTVTPGEFTNV